MQESHVEGVATHDGPESCVRAREGVDEAFDRGICGPGIESRNAPFQGADAVILSGRPHRQRRYRETQPSPARSETPCTYGTYLRENREICGLLGAATPRAASGRP